MNSHSSRRRQWEGGCALENGGEWPQHVDLSDSCQDPKASGGAASPKSWAVPPPAGGGQSRELFAAAGASVSVHVSGITNFFPNWGPTR